MSSVQQFMSMPLERRSPQSLLEMIACAIKLEHATIPPYLTALWSIEDPAHDAYGILQTVVVEEMAHMGFMCNLLTTLDGQLPLTAPDFVPQYPTPLPCGIAPRVIPPNLHEWQVGLSRLTPAVVSDIFMIIEYPECGPIAVADRPKATFHTIGEFYDAVSKTLEYLVDAKQITITGHRQINDPDSGVSPITNLHEALKAIEDIKEQGEGTPQSPDAPDLGNELAHYYRFKQIQVGRMYEQLPDKTWHLTGKFLDFPPCYPIADVPKGGYPDPVPPELAQFNRDYKALLATLQSAWDQGGTPGETILQQAELDSMPALTTCAVNIMKKPIDSGHPERGNYAPTFQIPP